MMWKPLEPGDPQIITWWRLLRWSAGLLFVIGGLLALATWGSHRRFEAKRDSLAAVIHLGASVSDVQSAVDELGLDVRYFNELQNGRSEMFIDLDEGVSFPVFILGYFLVSTVQSDYFVVRFDEASLVSEIDE